MEFESGQLLEEALPCRLVSMQDLKMSWMDVLGLAFARQHPPWQYARRRIDRMMLFPIFLDNVGELSVIKDVILLEIHRKSLISVVRI